MLTLHTLKSFFSIFLWHPTSSIFLSSIAFNSNADFYLKDYPQATGAYLSAKEFISPGRLLTNKLSSKGIRMPSSLSSVWDKLEVELQSFSAEWVQALLTMGLLDPCLAFSFSQFCSPTPNSLSGFLSGFPWEYFLHKSLVHKSSLRACSLEPDLRNLPLTNSWVRMELCSPCAMIVLCDNLTGSLNAQIYDLTLLLGMPMKVILERDQHLKGWTK